MYCMRCGLPLIPGDVHGLDICTVMWPDSSIRQVKRTGYDTITVTMTARWESGTKFERPGR